VTRRALIAIPACLLAAAASAQTPGFWLTGLAPTTTGGTASGLSQDGLVAVGGSSNGTIAPGFSWTRAGGRYDFGLEPGMLAATVAAATDALGQTIVGSMSDSQHSPRAYRRVGNAPLENLGVLPNELRSYAQGVSGDGSVIVGRCEHTTMGNAYGQAFRWTQGGGMQGLGYLVAGSSFSTARAVSRDGSSTIVGWSQSASLGIVDAFRWTESGGMVALPRLDAAIGADARAVNFDGSIIVGYASLGRAVMWRDGQATSLGHPTGWRSAVAQCVDDTGVVVGGRGTDGIGNPGACVWTPGTGMVPLADYLTANGVTIPAGWTLRDCTGVSADGMTFVGYGASDTRAGGFIATIPSPGPLAVGLAALPLVARRRRPTSSPNSPDRS